MTSENQNPPEDLDPNSLKAQLQRIWANTKKEVKILWNDRFAMLLLILLPITLILTIYTTELIKGEEEFSRNQTPILGVLDRDDSKGFHGYDLSEEFIKIFKDFEDKGGCILYEDNTENELEEKLGLGEIHAYLIIEDGFEFNLSVHFVAFFKVVIDSYRQMTLLDVESLLDEVTSIFADKFNFTGAIEQVIEYENVPKIATRLFQIAPFFFPIVIFSMTCLVNSQSIIGDIPKDRMVLTPTSKKEILAGKVLGSNIINLIMIITLWVLSLLLGMQTRGDPFTYLFILWTCALVGSSVGLLISSIAKTSLAAFQMFVLSFITQFILLLFIEDKSILTFFPIYTTQSLMTQVTLQGIGLFESGYFMPYILVLWLEFIIFIALTYVIFKRTRSLI